MVPRWGNLQNYSNKPRRNMHGKVLTMIKKGLKDIKYQSAREEHEREPNARLDLLSAAPHRHQLGGNSAPDPGALTRDTPLD